MAERYFITGATGNTGAEVLRHLSGRGKEIIAGYHGRRGESRESVLYRYFSFTDSSTWAPCLEGVTKVLLVRPPHISRIKRDLYPFLSFLKKRQIKQVVFLSVQGVENNRIVPHFKIEKYLRELEIPYTFLRPSFFMQNLTTTHLDEIRKDRILFVPAGRGRTNFIDVRDIGEIGARILQEPSHLNRAYTITGSQSYSYREVAEKLSEELGFTINFRNPRPIQFLVFHLSRGRTLAMSLVMLALYTVVKSGRGDITTNTAEDLLGRKPKSLEQFIRDQAALFREEL